MPEDSVRDQIIYRRKHEVDPEEYLLAGGVIEECEDEKELQFTSEFSEVLANEITIAEEVGVRKAAIAQLFGVSVSEIIDQNREYEAYKIGDSIYKWPSRAALLFDLAIDTAMRKISENWDSIPPKLRHDMAKSLRLFQDRCYFCEGVVETGQEIVESCCSQRGVLTFRCVDCDRRFLEFSAQIQKQ